MKRLLLVSIAALLLVSAVSAQSTDFKLFAGTAQTGTVMVIDHWGIPHTGVIYLEKEKIGVWQWYLLDFRNQVSMSGTDGIPNYTKVSTIAEIHPL